MWRTGGCDLIKNCSQIIAESCYPTPCGQNTQCTVVNGVPTCSCIKGYTVSISTSSS